MGPSKISLRGVTKAFGPKKVLQGIDLEVTPEGLRVLKAIRTKRTAWLSARLSALTDVDLAAIADAIAPLEALLVPAE